MLLLLPSSTSFVCGGKLAAAVIVKDDDDELLLLLFEDIREDVEDAVVVNDKGDEDVDAAADVCVVDPLWS